MYIFRTCVHQKGLNSRWLPPATVELKALRAVGKKKTKSVNSDAKDPITDEAFLQLINILPDTGAGRRWKLAVAIAGVFGLRPCELNHVRAKGNVLHCDDEKQSANRCYKSKSYRTFTTRAKT